MREKLFLESEETAELHFGTFRVKLAGGHLLSHVKQEPAVAFFNATHEPAKLVQQTRLFSGTAPDNVVSVLTLGKIGKLGRLFAVIEKLIEWDFQSARHFLQRLDGRNGMAIFNAGDVATKQSGALFDIPLRVFFFFAQCAKPIAYNHFGIVPQSYSARKRKS
jgi:hypothetical protein